MLPEIYLRFAKIFKDHGFSLYLVGGSVRDYLLGLEVRDLDFVTDATPSEMKGFLNDYSDRYANFGVMSIKHEGKMIDIVTFRYESGYEDSRHPKKVVFVKDMYLDSTRRDFTINAMYLDQEGTLYDYHEGLKDLSQHVLRFVGDPASRVKEDPLRIIRGRRFASRLGLRFDPETEKAMIEGEALLDKLNPEKVSMERKKE